jgi:hypothetical protein
LWWSKGAKTEEYGCVIVLPGFNSVAGNWYGSASAESVVSPAQTDQAAIFPAKHSVLIRLELSSLSRKRRVAAAAAEEREE